MKVKQVTEFIVDSVLVPSNHPLCQPPGKGNNYHLPENLLAAEATQLYCNQNPNIAAIQVQRASLALDPVNRETRIAFRATVQRDILIPELTDYATIPLEQRPWYVRPRRKLMEKQP